MNDMNLLPEWYVRERMRNRADMFCVVLFGIVMAILMVDEYVGRRKLRESRDKYSVVKAQFEDACQATKDFNSGKLYRDKLLREVENNITGQQYFTPLRLMDLLSQCAKGGVRFDSSQITTKWQVPGGTKKTVTRGTADAKKVKPVPVRQVTVRLDGTVSKEEELSRLELQLRKTNVFSEVRLEQSQIVNKSGKDDKGPARSKFTMRLTVKPDKELVEVLLRQKILGKELEAEEESQRLNRERRTFQEPGKEESK